MLQQKLNKRIQTDFYPYEIYSAYELLLNPKIGGLSYVSKNKYYPVLQPVTLLSQMKTPQNYQNSQRNTNLYDHLKKLQE